MARAFTLDRGRIRFDDVAFVYLERTLAGESRSYGTTPVALAGDTVIAAVAPGEATWLGFQAVDRARPATLRVRIDGAEPLDAVTGEPWVAGLTDRPRNHVVTPPDYRLPHFDATAFTVICCSTFSAEAAVRLVDLEEFTRRTGIVPPPLDASNAYGGWRLP